MSEGVKVGSLFMELGFDVDQVKLSDVVQSIGKLNFNSILAAAGFAGVVDGLKNIMDVASQVTENMFKFSTITGMSSQTMQQWSQYAQKMGAGADLVQNSLSQLQLFKTQFETGNLDPGFIKGILTVNQVLTRLKLPNLTTEDLKNPPVMLEKITEAMSHLDKATARTFLSYLHLSDELLLVKSFKGADDLTPTNEQINSIHLSIWSPNVTC